MSLRAQIDADTKDAMRARDKGRLGTLRLLSAALKQKEVDERVTLEDADVLAVIEKLIKQRRESARQYVEAGRNELADTETAEAALLETYLPAQLDEAALGAIIDECIGSVGAAGPQDMGKVMGVLKPRIQGQADMGLASKLVKARLSA